MKIKKGGNEMVEKKKEEEKKLEEAKELLGFYLKPISMKEIRKNAQRIKDEKNQR